MHPPFLFCLAKRETGRARSKEKNAWRTPVRGPSVRTGGGGSVPAPIWADRRARLGLLRFLELPSRGGWCRRRRGGRCIASASLFAAAGCSSRKRERQRGEPLKVSPTSPGWRFPQGPGVSVPDFCKGAPAFPRRRQEGRIYAARPAEAFFSFGPCTARFLFGKIEKKMGGALPSHHHGCHSSVQWDAPPVPPRNTESAPAHTLSRGDLG